MSTSYGEKASSRIDEDMGTAFAIDRMYHYDRIASAKKQPLTRKLLRIHQSPLTPPSLPQLWRARPTHSPNVLRPLHLF
jgi:hypothetical protein